MDDIAFLIFKCYLAFVAFIYLLLLGGYILWIVFHEQSYDSTCSYSTWSNQVVSTISNGLSSKEESIVGTPKGADL